MGKSNYALKAELSMLHNIKFNVQKGSVICISGRVNVFVGYWVDIVNPLFYNRVSWIFKMHWREEVIICETYRK